MFTEVKPNMPAEAEVSCAASFGPRGIHADDARGEVSTRRAKELSKTMVRLRLEDQRTWVALKRQRIHVSRTGSYRRVHDDRSL